MPLHELAAALALLLLAPGPTNTLMALAGAERGIGPALRLIPAEIAAYLAVTVPLAVSGEAAFAAAPGLRVAINAVAALWVAALALALWRLPAAGASDVQGGVTARRIFVTTLLNPKALVIGLVLLPGEPIGGRILVLAVLIAAVALAWMAFGAGAVRGPAGAGTLRRLAAVWLGVLAAGLAWGATSATAV